MNAIFYFAGSVAIIATIMVLTRTNAVHALLYLIVSLLSVALVFYTMGAPFVAVLEVIVYAGAIMVLFLFAIMILNLGGEASDQERKWLHPSMWLGPSVLVLILIGELVYVVAQPAGRYLSATIVEPKQVGFALYSPYLLGIEMASMLLLAGLVGAYHLGRRPKPGEQGGEGET
jgi:NADH-quinone oxidoreductase subunit J